MLGLYPSELYYFTNFHWYLVEAYRLRFRLLHLLICIQSFFNFQLCSMHICIPYSLYVCIPFCRGTIQNRRILRAGKFLFPDLGQDPPCSWSRIPISQRRGSQALEVLLCAQSLLQDISVLVFDRGWQIRSGCLENTEDSHADDSRDIETISLCLAHNRQRDSRRSISLHRVRIKHNGYDFQRIDDGERVLLS